MRYTLVIPLLAIIAWTASVPVLAQEPIVQEEIPAAVPTPATEQGASAANVDLGLDEISDVLRLSDEDPRTIAVRLINVALGFLAIITVIMILWGGFQFLLSGGQEEKTERAGATIRNAIIGLIIILSSWAMVQYILEQFVNVTTAP